PKVFATRPPTFQLGKIRPSLRCIPALLRLCIRFPEQSPAHRRALRIRGSAPTILVSPTANQHLQFWQLLAPLPVCRSGTELLLLWLSGSLHLLRQINNTQT